MQTTNPVLRAETRMIGIQAPREDVLLFLADATNLPRWAPNFAVTVDPKDRHWLINAGCRPVRDPRRFRSGPGHD